MGGCVAEPTCFAYHHGPWCSVFGKDVHLTPDSEVPAGASTGWVGNPYTYDEDNDGSLMAIDGSSLVANSGDQTLKGNSGPWKAGDQVLTVDTTKENPEYICVEMADDHPAAKQRAAIATKDAAIATKDATIAANTADIATKDTAIATKDAAIKNCGQAGTSLVDAMVFEISMTAAGTVETVDKAGFETNMRTYLGCKAPLCQVAIAVTAGSVNVVATVTDSTSTAVAATKTQLIVDGANNGEKMPTWAIGIIVVIGAMFLLVVVILGVIVSREQQGKPVFVPSAMNKKTLDPPDKV